MNNLIWVLESGRSSSFGNKGVSSSYLIPKNDIVRLMPEKLAGARLWVVLRGDEDRLLKLIKIKKVELITEGYHSGDFLVSSDIAQSFKLFSGFSSGTNYSIKESVDFKLGISELNTVLSLALRHFVIGKVRKLLANPPEKIISQINLKIIPKNNRQLVLNALKGVAANLTLDQIWANGFDNRLGPFANFAYAAIGQVTGIKKIDIIEDLDLLDPINVLFNEGFQEPKNNPQDKKTSTPVVDTDFVEIIPENVCARKFLVIDPVFSDLEAAINKTEHSEEIHQAMLKDISSFLIAHEITPFESGSIDLMYVTNETLNVIEIKSSHSDNILAQAAKGAFQLACYQKELNKSYANVTTRLILHKTESVQIDEYVSAILSMLGIVTLFYKPNEPWPNRVSNLPLPAVSSVVQHDL